MRAPRGTTGDAPGANSEVVESAGAPALCCLYGRPRMEPLWSPVVATGGNRSQIARARKRQKQAKTVAVGCHRLPATFHGKQGVDGSSPSEGSARYLQIACFRSARLAGVPAYGRYGAVYGALRSRTPFPLPLRDTVSTYLVAPTRRPDRSLESNVCSYARRHVQSNIRAWAEDDGEGR